MKPVWDGKRVRAAPDGAAVALLRPPRDRRRRRRALLRLPGRRAVRSAAGAAVSRRGQGPGHRGLRRRAGDRDPGRGRRHRRRRGSAGHARVRQGDDGRARAGRRDRQAAGGRRSATACLGGQRAADARVRGRGDAAARRRLAREAPATPPAPRRRPPRPTPAAPTRHREPASRRRDAEADRDVQVVVLGSGPGGYTAAFRAADLGLKTVADRALRHARRRLPERRLHPLQGAAACRARDRRGRGDGAHGITFGTPTIDLGKLHRVEGRRSSTG